jgi:hypothetical protein
VCAQRQPAHVSNRQPTTARTLLPLLQLAWRAARTHRSGHARRAQQRAAVHAPHVFICSTAARAKKARHCSGAQRVVVLHAAAPASMEGICSAERC